MNFIDDRSLRAAVESRGFGTGVREVQLLTKVNGLAYRVAKTALDAARMVSATATVQPENFVDVARLHAMLMTPVMGRSGSHGGGPVLPGAYFGEPESSAYSRGGAPVLPGAYFGRPESMQGGAPDLTMPLVYYGGPESTSSYMQHLPEPAPVDPGLARAALSSTFPSASILDGGGGVRHGCVTDDAISRIMKEYRARHGSNVRISDTARQALRRIVNSNVNMALDEALVLSKKQKKKTLGVAAFAKVAQKWTLRL